MPFQFCYSASADGNFQGLMRHPLAMFRAFDHNVYVRVAAVHPKLSRKMDLTGGRCEMVDALADHRVVEIENLDGFDVVGRFLLMMHIDNDGNVRPVLGDERKLDIRQMAFLV